METAFDYLNEVHEDLLEAAARQRARMRAVPAGPPRRRVPWPGLVAASVAVLLAAGVIGAGIRGGSEDSAPASGETGAAATGATGVVPGLGYDEGGEVPDAAHDAVQEEQAEGGEAQSEGPPQVTRVIRTAELTVIIERDAFDATFGQAVDVAEEAGGFVASSNSYGRSGSLTLRVPADAFDETLRALRGLGEVRVESLRGKDVTADYVDLRARLRIAKARREVLLGLMREATSIEQTIRVQNALDETQLRIEELQGALRLLDDRTSLATITLDLRERGVEPESEVETPSIPNAFERAIAGSVGVVAAIVIGLGYLLPLIVLGLAAWFIVTRVQRRRAGR